LVVGLLDFVPNLLFCVIWKFLNDICDLFYFIFCLQFFIPHLQWRVV
jgi:hypothetical protein